MTALDWLATELRRGGLRVVEEPGWQSRGQRWGTTADPVPVGGMQHHTAPPVPFPVTALYRTPDRIKANLNTKRDGTIHIIAANACTYSSGSGSHVVLDEVRRSIAPTGTAASRGLPDTTGGNRHFINNEADHAGDGSPIPTPQLDAIVQSWAVICERLGWSAAKVIAHAEWTARKPDPRWNLLGPHGNLNEIRRRVTDLLENTTMTMTPAAARLEVFYAFAWNLGALPDATPTEDPQTRLTRIAEQVADGRRTLASLNATLAQFTPPDVTERRARAFTDAEIPAWVLVPRVPATNTGIDILDTDLEERIFQELARRIDPAAT